MKLPIVHKVEALTVVLLLMIPIGSIAQKVEDQHKQDKKEANWLLRLLFGDEPEDKDDEEVKVGTLFRTINLHKKWKFRIGDNLKWISPSYDDRSWESIKVPSTWENQGFHGYDGYAWYRLHFDGRKLAKNQKCMRKSSKTSKT